MPRLKKETTEVDGRVITVWKQFKITLVDGKPTHISDGHNSWWNYRRDHEGFDGYPLFLMFGREYHIVLVTHNREVADVIPVADLPDRYYTALDELAGGRGPLAIARLKDVFAKQLGYTPLFSNVELIILAEHDPPRLLRNAMRRSS